MSSAFLRRRLASSLASPLQRARLEDEALGAVRAAVDPALATVRALAVDAAGAVACLLYTSPSPRDRSLSRMPSSA